MDYWRHQRFMDRAHAAKPELTTEEFGLVSRAGGQGAWRGSREDIRHLANLACRLARELNEAKRVRDSLQRRLERMAGNLETAKHPLVGFGEHHDARGNRFHAVHSHKVVDALKKEMGLEWKGNGYEIGKFVSLAFRFLDPWFSEALQAAYDHGYKDGADVIRAVARNETDPFASHA